MQLCAGRFPLISCSLDGKLGVWSVDILGLEQSTLLMMIDLGTQLSFILPPSIFAAGDCWQQGKLHTSSLPTGGCKKDTWRAQSGFDAGVLRGKFEESERQQIEGIRDICEERSSRGDEEEQGDGVEDEKSEGCGANEKCSQQDEVASGCTEGGDACSARRSKSDKEDRAVASRNIGSSGAKAVTGMYVGAVSRTWAAGIVSVDIRPLLLRSGDRA